MDKKVIIGITGGYATGKTTVTEFFVMKGAHRIDADAIAHALLKDEDIKNSIVETFGKEIASFGEINRRKLAQAVFFDADKLDKLCEIMHPTLLEIIKSKVDAIEEGVVAIDAPLLFEANLDGYVDVTIVVTAPVAIQVERGKIRGITGEEAKKRIESQMPLRDKAEKADYTIDTNCDLNEIKEGVDKIWQEL